MLTYQNQNLLKSVLKSLSLLVHDHTSASKTSAPEPVAIQFRGSTKEEFVRLIELILTQSN